MQPEDIDKLFRAKLEQHATPPPPSLWYDLQEQLEPEEKKRRGGFWMYAVAAAVTLLLVAGGSWLLWQGPQFGGNSNGTLASGPAQSRPSQNGSAATAPATTTPAMPEGVDSGADSGTEDAVDTPVNPADLAARPDAAPATDEAAKNSQKTAVAQATDANRLPSTHQQQQLLARTERAAAHRQPARSETPDFRPAPQAPVVERQALAAHPVPAPAPTTNAAALTPSSPAVATVPTMGAIEVEVRQQPDNVVVLAAAPTADETPGRTRPSVRGVLRQVRRLAQGEKPDLTEVGLPANPALTVQAHVAGRTLTKTISL